MAFLPATRCCRSSGGRVEQGSGSFWTFCVDYLEPTSGVTADGRQAGQRGKVDYKEVLSPEDFVIFAGLREVRKEMAQKDGVPVYTIFTNDQLAQHGAGGAGE